MAMTAENAKEAWYGKAIDADPVATTSTNSVMSNTMMAVPNVAATCRPMTCAVLPCGTSGPLSPESENVTRGPIRPDTPMARIVCQTARSHSGVSSPTNTHETEPTTKNVPNMSVVSRGDVLSAMTPDSGFTISAVIVEGKMTSPASSDVPPSTSMT